VIAAALLLVLVSGSSWVALRAVSRAVPADIPACCRPRVEWWLRHAHRLTASCMTSLAVAVALSITALLR
jgi:hypothetical protein